MLLSFLDISLLVILFVLLLVQVLYILIFLGRPVRYMKKKANQAENKNLTQSADRPPVSILICASNEAENLKKNLPYLLEQVYPVFEVIVINEGSSDQTEEVLTSLEANYKHLYHTYIPPEAKSLSKKKLALTLGIKAAKYDILLFTEPDCIPSSPYWVQNMMAAYNASTDIVLGYTAFPKSTGFISKLAVYDQLIFSLHYLSSALKGQAYMGVGRNLSYKKHLFVEGKGYKPILRLYAGEDNLFVNTHATNSNTRVEIAADSIMVMQDWNVKIESTYKNNYMSTARYYQRKVCSWRNWGSVLTALFYLAVVGSVVYACALLPTWTSYTLLAAAAFSVLSRWGILGYVLCGASKRLQKDEKNMALFIPIADLFYPLAQVVLKLKHLRRRKQDYIWKL